MTTFYGFCGKGIPIGSWHSIRYTLCPSSCRNLCFLIRSGYHTVSALSGSETASWFNFTYKYIDEVVYKQHAFENYLVQMYPIEVEITDTTESITSDSYLDLLLSFGRDSQLHAFIYIKRDDFNFDITSFLFMSSNIPSSPAYMHFFFISQLGLAPHMNNDIPSSPAFGVFISQLICFTWACSSYECFILRAR